MALGEAFEVEALVGCEGAQQEPDCVGVAVAVIVAASAVAVVARF